MNTKTYTKKETSIRVSYSLVKRLTEIKEQYRLKSLEAAIEKLMEI